MTEPSCSEECAMVRDAVLTGFFEEISRQDVERHLAAHDPCAQWAENVLLVTHLMATEPVWQRASGEIGETLLEAYLDGSLPEAQREAVEDACCHDLEFAGQLQELRRRRFERRVQVIESAKAAQVLQAVQPWEDVAVVARLEDFRGLYLYKPLAVAAAQAKRSTFQSPDGNFVVSVVDKEPRKAGEPHLIELGIQVHQPKWIGNWACYRVADGRGKLAAAGLVKIEEKGSCVRVTVPPTEHAPYTVHAQVLEVEAGELQEMIERIVARSDSGPPST
ncbi:MAG: hypothetical protein ACYSWU_13740, partial [Planctomycetota bacterium]